MFEIVVQPLREDLSFGSRVQGVSALSLQDEAVCGLLRDVFERSGLIVFEDVEPSSLMHVAISNVFGPLKDHPVPSVGRVDADAMPGVIDMRHDPATSAINEVNGELLAQWLPWHFDHCYNNELNRAGVLRAIDIPPEGGLTLFADGIDLFRSINPGLRDEIDGLNILYTLNLSYEDMRFGRPKSLGYRRRPPDLDALLRQAATQPRAIHPAVWTRRTGEKVLHISPWGAVGIERMETPEGDDLLERVCQEINHKAVAYAHRWKSTDMLIWDNWRVLHAVSGFDPAQTRRMHRTTIKGDYGLGYFENEGVGGSVLGMTF